MSGAKGMDIDYVMARPDGQETHHWHLNSLVFLFEAYWKKLSRFLASGDLPETIAHLTYLSQPVMKRGLERISGKQNRAACHGIRCIRTWVNPTDTYTFLKQDKWRPTRSRVLVFSCHRRFSDGHEDVGDLKRSGRSPMVSASDIKSARDMLKEAWQRTVRETGTRFSYNGQSCIISWKNILMYRK